jgi:hypothetical protein
LPWKDDGGPVPPCTEKELLERARARARAIGDRRHRQVGAGLLAALLLVAGVTALAAGDGAGVDARLETVSGDPDTSASTTTSTSPAPDTSLASPAEAPARLVPPPPTSPPRTSIPPVPVRPPTTESASVSTTTTTLLCRNSRDPACGPFVWDPPPGPNQPLTVTIAVSPEAPRAGETVTFRVVLDDPDGDSLRAQHDDVDYGDGGPTVGVGGHVNCAPGSGPWDSAARPVHEELVFTHVYAQPGTYTATFPFTTYGNCAYGPSAATARPTVTVIAARS